MSRRLLWITVLTSAWMSSSSVQAVNRLLVEDGQLSISPNQQQIIVRVDNDVTLFGASFGIGFDPAVLRVDSVTWEGALATEPEWFDGLIDNGSGMLGYGMVFDFGPFDNALPPGTNQPVAVLNVTVLASEETTTEITFADQPINESRPVQNRLTSDLGETQIPELVNATIQIGGAGALIQPYDVNLDGGVDISDPISDLNFQFAGVSIDACLIEEGGGPVVTLNATGLALFDWNGDGTHDISDPVGSLNFQFAGGNNPPHALGSDCLAFVGTCPSVCN